MTTDNHFFTSDPVLAGALNRLAGSVYLSDLVSEMYPNDPQEYTRNIESLRYRDFSLNPDSIAAFTFEPKPERNLPLLRKVYEHIVAFPEEWDQSNWAYSAEVQTMLEGAVIGTNILSLYTEEANKVRQNACGTSFCFAGTAVDMSPGNRIVWETTGYAQLCKYVDEATGEEKVDGIDNRARELLGLTRSEAQSLFGANNSLLQIERQLSEIFAAEGEEL